MSIKNSFYVWIVALSDAYVETLTGRLISHGWTVSINNRHGEVTTQQPNGQGASIINLSLVKETKDLVISCNDLVNELAKTCRLLEMQYYSIIVSLPVESAWYYGNIQAEEPEEEKLLH